VAALKDLDLELGIKLLNELEGREIKENSLYREIERENKKLELFFPGDTLLYSQLMRLDSVSKDSSVQLALNSASHSQPFFMYWRANRLFDLKRYDESVAVCKELMATCNENYIIPLLLAAGLRETGKYNQCDSVYDKILNENTEAVHALLGKTRLYYRSKQIEKCSEPALDAWKIDSLNASSLEAFILYNHVQKKSAETQRLWKKLLRQYPEESEQIERISTETGLKK
jgi:tetratricopeptide (TPR) repeat protein